MRWLSNQNNLSSIVLKMQTRCKKMGHYGFDWQTAREVLVGE
jgi:hypothetical protein